MPITPTYPGVYIEEVPSGVRTITGVATSITAFIGRALKGSVNEPLRIQSFGDFERKFGGLWVKSTLGYAVQQYFLNGGSDAVIVRLTSRAETATLKLDTGGVPLILEASSPGAWGNRLRATVTDAEENNVTLTIEEVDDPTANTPNVLQSVEFTAGSIDNLLTQLEGNTSIVLVPKDITPPSALPTVAGPSLFTGGKDGATKAHVVLPTTGAETLTLVAGSDVSGELGNNLRATIIHSTSDSTRFALIVTRVNAVGDTVDSRVFENLSIDNADPNYIGTVLAPSLVNITGSVPSIRPHEFTNIPFTGGDDSPSTQATVSLAAGGDTLILNAANEGSWGNNLRVTIDDNTADPKDTSIFNLTLEELDNTGQAIVQETFRNLSMNPDAPRYVEKVLEQESTLANTSGNVPTATPIALMQQPFQGGADGTDLNDTEYIGSQLQKTGLYALEKTDLFNLLCVPPPTRNDYFGSDNYPNTLPNALTYCKNRRALLIVDAPSFWNSKDKAVSNLSSFTSVFAAKDYGAIFFPYVKIADPLKENRLEAFAPCGAVAGIFARTDAQRGVWKAPAGIDATLAGVRELTVKLTDGENGQLNPLGVNCLRSFPVYGNVVWGSRTLAGDDRLASQWKYIPVRRLALFIEESLYRGTQWVVFEPNDEPLWAQIRLNIGAYMNNLFRQGAFQGKSPREAYFVKCDKETTTQNDINLGIVNIVVGFAPLKPAEFVIIKIQQMAGQIAI